VNAHAEEAAREKTTKGRETVDFGLALGGLAGNNAHGAGVLQAFLERGVAPQMISCTSGQIFWVDQFLQAGGDNLEGKVKDFTRISNRLQEHIKESNPTGIQAFDLWLHLVDTDKERKIRIAVLELPFLMMRNLCQSYVDLIGNFEKFRNPWNFYFKMLTELLPARTLISQYSDDFYEGISKRLNKCEKIGILFNGYNVKEGREQVYLNRRAFEILGFKEHWRTDGVYQRPSRYRTDYRPITPDAVRKALWIYEYGMPTDGGTLDGAYFRQMILDELARAKTIIAARPVNFKWVGTFPHSWIGQKDLKTEVNFNGSYAGEREKILSMNEMILGGKISDSTIKDREYHEVKFQEIEIASQEGFFGYACESMEVFERARVAMLNIAEECFCIDVKNC